jgi:hypothetical protein
MDYSEFSNRLLEREEILWSGRPASGLLFTGQDIFLIPFSLLWGGFALFAAFSALTQAKEPGFPALFLIPFVLIGLYLIVGRFIVDAWVRSGLRYALTNKRVLILRPTPFSKFTALNLDRLPELSLSEGANGRGTIRFGRRSGGPGATTISPAGAPRSIRRRNSSGSRMHAACLIKFSVRRRRRLEAIAGDWNFHPVGGVTRPRSVTIFFVP